MHLNKAQIEIQAVFSSRFGTPESGLRDTVFRSEHCSAFYFLVQKIVQK
jgi:hypothetical protein